MSSFLYRKRASKCWVVLCRNPKAETQFVPSLLFSTLREPQPRNLNKPPKPQNATIPIESHMILDPGPCSFSPKTSKTLPGSLQNVKNSIASAKSSGFSSNLGLPKVKSLFGFHGDLSRCSLVRLFGTQAAQEPSTSDGLTVDRILNSEWPILTEDESDWKSHAAAIAQSIHLIKKRLQWKKLLVRLDMLSVELNKPDLWNDPVHAGKISREHGSLMGKMKEVKAFEQELLEHVDMIKLAREENDVELESVGSQYFS